VSARAGVDSAEVASSKSRLPASKSRLLAHDRGSKPSTRSRIATAVRGPLAFGFVMASGGDELRPKIERFLRALSKHSGAELELHQAASYEDLAKDVKKGRIDIAWLPPIVHVRLASDVVPLGSILRDGRTTYEAALIVRKDSKAKTIANLRGMRAGWVDRWSAAGFVLPRVNLALLGIDARTFFRSESFHGSHRAVVQALLDGACDVAGTYAQADGKGKVKGGAWSDVPGAEVRVLTTFGAIPPDVIAARRGLAETHRDSARDALRAICMDATGRGSFRDVFGGDTFVEDTTKSYESLARALDMAQVRGLFG
jgi:phosphate/phosphite/phosphonate ABC transporter binding protein